VGQKVSLLFLFLLLDKKEEVCTMIKLNLFLWSKLLYDVYEQYGISLDTGTDTIDPLEQSIFILRMYTYGNEDLLSKIDYENIRLALRMISLQESSSLKIKDANDYTTQIRHSPYKLKVFLINKINSYYINKKTSC
jgi:hypothetical protein